MIGSLSELTLDALKKMEPNKIFATGYTTIIHPWFNNTKLTNVNADGDAEPGGRYVIVRWVAVRGGIHDWAIYHSLDANLEPARYLDGFAHLSASYQKIADHGAKLRDLKKIKELVNATDEAMEMYRQ